MNFRFLLFIILAFIFYWLLNPYYNSDEELFLENEPKAESVDSTVSVSFSVVGDLMCHSTQYNYAWVEKDSFDFNPVYRIIGDYLVERDILIGNLETVLAGETKNYQGYPFFNTPNEFAYALKNAGFDFLTTANNHANDQGFEGVKRTLEVLKETNIIPLGTRSLDSSKIYNVFVRKGLRFGLLAYTYGTNYNENALRPKAYVNHIDTLKIRKDINELKSQSVDLIIVLFHYGEQYQKNISEYQRKITNKTVEYGADIILGSHPHIIQKFEQFNSKNSNLNPGFVIYSLGNFISNQRWRYSDGGLIFNFEITKNIFTDSIYVSHVGYLPIWVFKGNTENGREYIILPADTASHSTYDFMTQADIDSMKKSYFDTIMQLGENSKMLTLDKVN